MKFLLEYSDTALLNQQKLELEKLITEETKETIFTTESIADAFRIVQCASTVISFSRKKS